jgi:succinate dehydrogenase / fumarate reductase flavoprotein subunit
LIRDNEGAILGALVLEIETGEPLLIEAKATVLATGGCGQVFRTTSNAHINTGDGMAMALRAGVPLMDMEFYQFHPTGIAGKGMLITEGVRGEGGYLVNKDGERFMERYAPNAKDLASRDVVSRAIVTEVKEGRGCGPNGDHVLLKLDHLGEDIIQKRLPGIRESGKIFAGVDAAVEPLPVFPTAHYIMGGIPTDRYGRVIVPHGSGEEIVPGLYAAGEAACVSVHGANRLGGNSLLDILVFGRAAGLHVLDNMEEHHRPMNEDSVDQAMQSLQRWDRKGDGLSVRELRDEFRKTMEDHAGVFRTEEIMSEGVEKIKDLRKKMDDGVLTDHSKVFNTARIEALELQNLMDCGIALAASALARKESRGAHSRPDYPDRNDAEWMKHSLYYLEGDRIDFKPVQTKPLTVESFPPKERVY